MMIREKQYRCAICKEEFDNIRLSICFADKSVFSGYVDTLCGPCFENMKASDKGYWDRVRAWYRGYIAARV
jgi:hypothetical protein